MKKITGNKLLVKALKEEGVDILFGYPGACTIDISDELYKQDYTKVVLPRHEQALVHAADAYARSTGKVGVCLVTSGPGATNLVTGIATANYDSVPLVCFTGQVARHLIGNDKIINRLIENKYLPNMIFYGPQQGFYMKNSTFTYGYDNHYQTVWKYGTDDCQEDVRNSWNRIL